MIKIKSYSSWMLAALVSILSCQSPSEAEKDLPLGLTIANPNSLPVADGPVVITRDQIAKEVNIPDNMLPVLIGKDSGPIPCQVDDTDGDGNWDELAAVVALAPSAAIRLALTWVAPKDFPSFPLRTSVHLGRREAENEGVKPVTQATLTGAMLPAFNKNQMDGPAWENDKVGYRLYFDGRNARDVFGKSTREMVLQNVGKDENGIPIDNYHVLEPWGRDVLSVGNSMGAGGIGLAEDGQVFRLGTKAGSTSDNVDSTTFKLIAKGPVRSIFQVDYHGWSANGNKLSVKNTIAIWAGQHWYSNQLVLGGFSGTKELAIGLVDSNNDNPVETLETGQHTGIMTHDMQTYDKEFFLGLALVVPEPNFLAHEQAPEGADVSQTQLLRIVVKPGEPVTYWVFSGWELQDPGFTEPTYFFDLVTDAVQALELPLQIKIGG